MNDSPLLEYVSLGEFDTHEPLKRCDPAEQDVQFEADGLLQVKQEGLKDEHAPKNIRIVMVMILPVID